jgi:aryl sulfotransferase
MFLHFADLKRDLPGQMRAIAAFLSIAIDESNFPSLVEYCSFDWMKRNASRSVPLGGLFWDGGAEVFINQGVNGRWLDTLTRVEAEEYEMRAERELGRDCARWLARGGVVP